MGSLERAPTTQPKPDPQETSIVIRVTKSHHDTTRLVQSTLPFGNPATTHANVPQEHEALGRLASHIRAGNTQTPPPFKEELLSLGFDMRNQRDVQRVERWTNTYMPAFRAFHTEYSHANVATEHEALGTLVDRIRSGRTQIPPPFKEDRYEYVG